MGEPFLLSVLWNAPQLYLQLDLTWLRSSSQWQRVRVALVELFFTRPARRHNWDKRLGGLHQPSRDRLQGLTQDPYLTAPVSRKKWACGKKIKIGGRFQQSCVREQVFSSRFQEMCNISHLACLGVTALSAASLSSVWGRGKRWIHYHLVKYKCHRVVQQEYSNVSWKIYCLRHKILMEGFTKTFRQAVSLYETNKQTSIWSASDTSQQTAHVPANKGSLFRAITKYKY